LADPAFARTTHRDLVFRCAEAGPEDSAWLEFFSRFHARVRLTVYRAVSLEAERHRGADIGSPAELVEDLVQETYVKLLAGERRALARFRGRSENSIYTYLAAVGVNVVRDHFKKLRALKAAPAVGSLSDPPTGAVRRPGSGSLGEWIASPALGPEAAARASELTQKALEAITRAAGTEGQARRDRLVFRLFFVEQNTVDEIVACGGVGLSRSGVEKCIRRLRELIRAELGSEGGLGAQKSS
jgi:RNA polymerase sigma factor (sigma-70 family)